MRVQFGEITFDSETREVSRAGKPLRLPPKAFQLLQILLEKRPAAVSKDELMERLWPDVFVEEANLKNLVVELRRALGQQEIIRTVPRFGYAFAGTTSSAPPRGERGGKLIARDHVYLLRRGENVLGRGEDCSVLIDSSGVSRHHARLTVSDSGAILEDTGSKNGTWLNGARLTGSAPLKSGDTIDLGVAHLIYRAPADDDSTVTLDVAQSRP